MIIRCLFLLFALKLALLARADKIEFCPDAREYLQGKRIPCHQLAGAVTLLQFWASWCPSCSGLMRDLEAVALARPKLRYLSVSTDEKRDSAMRALASLPYTEGLRLHDATQRWATRYAVQTVPTIVVLSADGEIIYRHEGHLSAQDLLAIGLALDAEGKRHEN